MGQRHVPNAQLVKHPQGREAAVDGVPPFDANQACYLFAVSAGNAWIPIRKTDPNFTRHINTE